MAKKQHEDKNPPEFIKEAKKRLKKDVQNIKGNV